jgi:hypothetical protein
MRVSVAVVSEANCNLYDGEALAPLWENLGS